VTRVVCRRININARCQTAAISLLQRTVDDAPKACTMQYSCKTMLHAIVQEISPRKLRKKTKTAVTETFNFRLASIIAPVP